MHGQPLAAAAHRHLLGALLIFLAYGLRHGRVPRRPPGWAIFVFAALQVFALQALLFLGMEQVRAGPAATMLYVYPLLTALLATAFLDERLSVGNWFGLLLGVTGILIMVFAPNPGLAQPYFGYLLIFGSAASWAIATVLFKRVQIKEDFFGFNAWSLLIGGIMLQVMALGSNQWRSELVAPYALAMGWLALQVALAMTLWYWLLSHNAASRISAFLFLVPVMSFGLAWVILAEPVPPSHLVAALLIGGGVHFGTRPGA